jgi:hypothetical protein
LEDAVVTVEEEITPWLEVQVEVLASENLMSNSINS